MKQPTRIRKTDIDNFINSADADHVTNVNITTLKTKKTVKFKPATFSLDEETKNLIESLSIRSAINKTSKSDIIKIAVKNLVELEQNNFENLVTDHFNTN
jgi:hydroxylamine reductase (hybrid-cluster protein)